MTNDEQRYKTNAETCRAVGHFLEVLRKKFADHKRFGQLEEAVETFIDIAEVQHELNELYDEQLELFPKVQHDRQVAANKLKQQATKDAASRELDDMRKKLMYEKYSRARYLPIKPSK